MRYQTMAPIEYKAAGTLFKCTIPAGTEVVPATNLPHHPEAPRFWAKAWDDMDDSAESWERSYGFLLEADDVEEFCTCAACEGLY